MNKNEAFARNNFLVKMFADNYECIVRYSKGSIAFNLKVDKNVDYHTYSIIIKAIEEVTFSYNFSQTESNYIFDVIFNYE